MSARYHFVIEPAGSLLDYSSFSRPTAILVYWGRTCSFSWCLVGKIHWNALLAMHFAHHAPAECARAALETKMAVGRENDEYILLSFTMGCHDMSIGNLKPKPSTYCCT
jgi:hypothetical protein